MIYGPDAGPIKVANEWDPGETKCILGRHHAEEVWVVFNCVNGIRVGVRNLRVRFGCFAPVGALAKVFRCVTTC